MGDITPKKPDLVEYRVGRAGLADAANYDRIRYAGPANEYKQAVMARAYKELMGNLQGRRLLDVGCGTGRGVVDFGREASFAIGSDASLDMLSLARRKVSDGVRCALAAAYAQQLPFPDGTFDAVTSLNFLHLFEVAVQQEMIAEMKRVTKPGGILVLEFDNALHGFGLGLYKRWSGREEGSLPGEIRRAIGDRCRVERVYGAVFPVVWRLFHRFPRLFMPVEKMAFVPPFNRVAHRVYYKLTKLS